MTDMILVVRCQAKIAAIQARIEAMKIFNAERLSNGLAPGYDENQFFSAERELEEIAQSLT